MDLLDDYKEFLDCSESYCAEDKFFILKLLNKYYKENSEKISQSILQELEKVVLGSNEKYLGKLFSPTNKYVIGSLISDLNLVNKDLWILLSVVSRLKIFKRQRNNNYLFSINELNITDLRNGINNDGIILINQFLEKKISYKNSK
tara:strand:+ start:30 stop:467 length:438 start_codon:yes stop_codon:yes gene_type:complete